MCGFDFEAVLCYPEEIKAQRIQHQKMERLLKDYKRRQQNEIKLLLLGTGEAGKSTFIRQMRIIHTGGFKDDERKSQIKVIHQNIFNSMQSMIKAMEVLEIEYEKEENLSKNSKLISYVDCETATFLIYPYVSALKELWADFGIQNCYMRRREYQLNDSTKYYLTKLDEIAEPGYIPSDQDILRIRIPTTGLVEHKFQVNGTGFCMTDVGGQRSERRKWMHCFDNVKSIIFLVAISEYDQVLVESGQLNRLRESKNVFESISSSSWFDDTAIILFLNKKDLLEEKIAHSHLDEYFPEFTGPRYDALAAREFILQMFEDVWRQKNKYHHFTCATDTENIKVVFSAVRDIILDKHLKSFGLD